MNNRELVKIIAEIWVANGGDSDGFLYSLLRIKNKIEEIEKENKQKESPPPVEYDDEIERAARNSELAREAWKNRDKEAEAKRLDEKFGFTSKSSATIEAAEKGGGQ